MTKEEVEAEDQAEPVALQQAIHLEQAARAAGGLDSKWWEELRLAAEGTVTLQSLDALLQEALTGLQRELEADAVALLMANEAGDELVARVAVGLTEDATQPLSIPIGEGMAGRVLATRRALVVDDLSEITLASPTLHDLGLRSVVAVPVGLEGRILGVLHADSFQLARFSERDARLLQSLADRLANAFERVRLFEAERTARREAELLSDRLAKMQRITALLSEAVSPERVALVLAESLAIGAGVEVDEQPWIGVWLCRNDRIEPVPTPTKSERAPLIGSVSLDSKLPLAEAVRSGHGSYVSSRPEALRRFPALADLQFVPESFATVPIGFGGRVLGVVTVAYPADHHFDGQEQAFLAAVAAQAAVAFDRVDLLARQRQLAEMSSFLARAAQVLAEASDLADTLDRLATVALPALGDICLIDVVNAEGEVTRMVAKHRDRARQDLVDVLRDRYAPKLSGPHPVAEILRGGTARWSAIMTDDFLRATTISEEHFSLTKKLGFRSYVAVPMQPRGSEVIGTVTLISTTRLFSSEDLAFAERLAQQVAAVVDNARRYDATYLTSKALQERLLPRGLPAVPGVTMYSQYLAATRELEVGGDYFDVIVLPSGRLGFTIGDVEGHDRDAVGLMGQLRSATRALAGVVRSPEAVIDALRGSWDRLGFERIATGIFGRLDSQSGDLVIASAGHYPPLVLSEGRAAFLDVPVSPPLGVPAAPAARWEGQLDRGSLLLLYTDGIIDERGLGPEGSMNELRRAVSVGEPTPTSVCRRIVERLPVRRKDDAALLAIRRDP